MPPKQVLDVFSSIDVRKEEIETIEFRGTELFFASIPADDGLQAWTAALSFSDRGYWPLLVVSEEKLNEIVRVAEELDYRPEGYPPAKTVDEIILASQGIDVEHYLSDRDEPIYKEDEWYGKWPEEEAELAPTFAQFFDIELNPDSEVNFDLLPIGNVLLVLCPVATPWTIPAFLNLGGWNYCPEPHEHVAIFRYWFEKFGAVPGFIAYDTFEFFVERPPKTKEDAIDLALKHSQYCPDTVDQGHETVMNLAAALLNCHFWHFWWD